MGSAGTATYPAQLGAQRALAGGKYIRQPALFIAGSRDGVLRFPAAQSQLDAYPKTLPGLVGSHIIEGAGHWVQQERPAEVNKLLIDFLKGL